MDVLRVDNIPSHTLASIERYIEDRVPVGDFLRCVISNDLLGAINHADEFNMPAIPAIVAYLWRNAPSICWKSERNYYAWLNGSADS